MKSAAGSTSRFNDVGLGKRLLLAALAVGTVAGPVALGLMQTPPLAGQILQATGPLPSFEVASIRPDHSGSGSSHIGYAGVGAPMDRFIVTNMTIKDLICLIFGGKPCPMLPHGLVSGGPGWINSDRYDIDAKLNDSDVAALYKLSNNSDRTVQVRLMVRALFADRFKLVVNDTTVMRPIYALVISKGGPKLQESIPGSPSPIELQGTPVHFLTEPSEIRAHGIPISTLANALSLERAVGRSVQDQTGLTGKYDFELKWSPPPGIEPGPVPGAETAPPPDTSGPSIFTAIQEQLGLELKVTNGPVKALVIAHIEKPSEN